MIKEVEFKNSYINKKEIIFLHFKKEPSMFAFDNSAWEKIRKSDIYIPSLLWGGLEIVYLGDKR